MSLLILGINYKSAPLAIREKVTYNRFNVKNIIHSIIKNKLCTGIVIVSTCNRTEIYFNNVKIYSVIKLLNTVYDFNFKEIKKNIYIYTGKDVINHLFNVVCGLDSMVLGETQILGQVKLAYNLSCELKCLDKVLNKLFQYAFFISKYIRNKTDICFNSTSIAKVAVQLASHIFIDIKNAVVMIVGAGDNAKIILQYLIKKGIKKLLISNRTSSNVLDLLNNISLDFNFKIIFLSVEMLFNDIVDVDIVITSTGSVYPIITKSKIEHFIFKRNGKPLYLIDIAVPRDIERSVGLLDNVYLYCIDDLEIMIEKTYKLKNYSSKKAKIFIDNGVENFFNWVKIHHNLHFLLNFRNKFYNISNNVFFNGMNMLKSHHDSFEVIKYVIYSLTNKLLHDPTMQIKKSIISNNVQFLKVINDLFNVI